MPSPTIVWLAARVGGGILGGNDPVARARAQRSEPRTGQRALARAHSRREWRRNARRDASAARRGGRPRLRGRRGLREDVRRLDRRPGRLLGRAGAPARLDQALHPGQEHVVRLRRRVDQVVRGRQAQRLGELHRPAPRDPRRPDGDHLGERRPERLRARQLSAAARRGLEAGQRAADHGGQEGGPRRPLPADDPGGGLRDARLRADRGGALGGLRRLLGRRAALAGRGTRARSSSSPPTRRRAAAGGRRSRPMPTRRSPASTA